LLSKLDWLCAGLRPGIKLTRTQILKWLIDAEHQRRSGEKPADVVNVPRVEELALKRAGRPRKAVGVEAQGANAGKAKGKRKGAG
jgi:hypothetical protein